VLAWVVTLILQPVQFLHFVALASRWRLALVFSPDNVCSLSRLTPLFATLTHSAPVTPLFLTLSSKTGEGEEGVAFSKLQLIQKAEVVP
jgi:hypothetical protein